jgi:hypothetical protein
MQEKTQTIIDNMVTLLNGMSSINWAGQYSVDNFSRINRSISALVLPVSLAREKQTAEDNCNLTIRVIIYNNRTNDRMSKLTEIFYDITEALNDSNNLTGAYCNLVSANWNWGSDGVSDDLTEAGQSGQKTIGTMDFEIYYRELR